MKISAACKNKYNLALAFIIAFSSYTLFYNLDHRLLWGDEAETALLAENITKFGVPKATDGRNEIAVFDPDLEWNDKDIWIHTPWLARYLSAGSFLLFGKSTTSARLPFAVMSLFTVVMVIKLTRRLYQCRETALLAALLLACNVAFILHARQCCYYAVLVFGQVLLVYGYCRLVSHKTASKRSGIAWLTAGLLMIFHSNYFLMIGNTVAIGISVLLIYKRTPGLIRSLIICAVLVAAGTLPWLFYAQPWTQEQAALLGFDNYYSNLIFYICQINFNIAPVLFFLLPIVLKRAIGGASAIHPGHSERPEKDTHHFLWILVFSCLVVAPVSYFRPFRYILPLTPVLLILCAHTAATYIPNRCIRYGLLSLLLFTNLISVVTFYPIAKKMENIYPQMPIVNFIREVNTEYKSTMTDVITFMEQNAKKNDMVLSPDNELSLIFYTDLQIVDARIRRPPREPDWVFARSIDSLPGQLKLGIPKEIASKYEKLSIKVHNSPFCDSRPDPFFRVPFTINSYDEFVIYKKISP